MAKVNVMPENEDGEYTTPRLCHIIVIAQPNTYIYPYSSSANYHKLL